MNLLSLLITYANPIDVYINYFQQTGIFLNIDKTFGLTLVGKLLIKTLWKCQGNINNADVLCKCNVLLQKSPFSFQDTFEHGEHKPDHSSHRTDAEVKNIYLEI